jgi:hypothetical protein
MTAPMAGVWAVFFTDEHGEKRLGSLHDSYAHAEDWCADRDESYSIEAWRVLGTAA